MERKKIKIGLFGFGVVGKGLYDVLHKTPGLHASIEKICVKDRNKKRPISNEWFTFDKNEILENPDINVIVELIDDSEKAFEIVSKALKKGISVVSANKKMIAEHFTELYDLQKQYKAALLYEGACCASIPVIRNLEEYYDNDLLNSVEGIFNGSTNYILSGIFNDKASYPFALAEAQRLGFAESDPRLDVEGHDPKYKLIILLAHAFGIVTSPENVFNSGIDKINDLDIQYANEKGYRIKLLASCKKVDNKVYASVFPKFVKKDSKLYSVDQEYNGVLVESVFADKQFFVGKGAGAFPTASAVLSDISALTYDYKYEYKKISQNLGYSLANDEVVHVYVRFSDLNSINKEAFIDINKVWQSNNSGYLCGNIKKNDLINQLWFSLPDVNVILLPEPEIQNQLLDVRLNFNLENVLN